MGGDIVCDGCEVLLGSARERVGEKATMAAGVWDYKNAMFTPPQVERKLISSYEARVYDDAR